jgi:hypothetical protein
LSIVGLLDQQAQQLMSDIEAFLGSPMPALSGSSEAAPQSSGTTDVWVPRVDADAATIPPLQGDALGWSRTGADEAAQVDAQLSRVTNSRTAADEALGGGFLEAAAAARRSESRLREILAELVAGARALQPSLDTSAGHRQMVDLLHNKAQDVRAVIAQARDASNTAASVMGSAHESYTNLAL